MSNRIYFRIFAFLFFLFVYECCMTVRMIVNSVYMCVAWECLFTVRLRVWQPLAARTYSLAWGNVIPVKDGERVSVYISQPVPCSNHSATPVCPATETPTNQAPRHQTFMIHVACERGRASAACELLPFPGGREWDISYIVLQTRETANRPIDASVCKKFIYRTQHLILLLQASFVKKIWLRSALSSELGNS